MTRALHISSSLDDKGAVYYGESFEVTVTLVNQDISSLPPIFGDEPLAVEVSAISSETNQPLVEVTPTPVIYSGHTTVMMVMPDNCIGHDFFLQVRSVGGVLSAKTSACYRVICAELVLEEGVPEVFFNDLKRNNISLSISLYDKNKTLLTSAVEQPLYCSAMCTSTSRFGEPVPVNVVQDNPLRGGRSIIKVRIESLSRDYGHSPFMLRIDSPHPGIKFTMSTFFIVMARKREKKSPQSVTASRDEAMSLVNEIREVITRPHIRQDDIDTLVMRIDSVANEGGKSTLETSISEMGIHLEKSKVNSYGASDKANLVSPDEEQGGYLETSVTNASLNDFQMGADDIGIVEQVKETERGTITGDDISNITSSDMSWKDLFGPDCDGKAIFGELTYDDYSSFLGEKRSATTITNQISTEPPMKYIKNSQSLN